MTLLFNQNILALLMQPKVSLYKFKLFNYVAGVQVVIRCVHIHVKNSDYKSASGSRFKVNLLILLTLKVTYLEIF